jgi:hypothetical protein
LSSDPGNRLIEVARARLSPDLQQQYDTLDKDAQIDIAVTLMACGDRLPPVFTARHLGDLINAVSDVIESITPAPSVVH